MADYKSTEEEMIDLEKANSSRKIAPMDFRSSNNKGQTAVEMVDDISTAEKEMPDKEEVNSSRKFRLAGSTRDKDKTVDFQNLIKAIKRGDVFKINAIAEKEKDLFTRTSPNGNTVLHIAAKYRNWLVVDQILKRDDKNPYFMSRTNKKGETPLHIAAKYGNVLVVCRLVYHKVGKGLLEVQDKEGNTALHNAIRHGHELIAEILIEPKDSSVTVINNSKQSPLSIAIDGRLNHIARCIIEKNASSLDHNGHEDLTILHSAVIRQDYDIMVYILTKKEDLINEVDTKKWNPLHYATASGHVKIARYLAQKNALLLYGRDINGQTPLHLAAKNDRRGVLKMLLKDYPDSIEMNDTRQRNILHVAAQNGNVKTVSFILRLPEMEDLVNSGDEHGNTPLHLAAMGFQSDVVYIFSKYMNVNIRAINGKKQTALEIVQTSTLKEKEIQKYLTTKALKVAYANRGLYEEDIQLDHRRAHLETLDAHQEQAVDAEGQLKHRPFAGVEDIESEGGRRGKEMAQTLSMMNTLIATFTFTAAFTIPGGVRGDGPSEGLATLVRRTSFRAFVITDTISMSSSMTAAVIVFWSFWCSKSESFMDSLPWAIGLTWIGLISMTLAFVTGLYVVLSEDMALASIVIAIGCVFPLIFYVFAPIVQLLSGQSANVNPFAFSFKMVKIFLKKSFGWRFRCLPNGCYPRQRKNKTYLSVALIHKNLFGFIYYWIKALVIALPRWIKALLGG